ncbi:hypothetical protein Sjap_009649 [Stephania japonica]|uniref:3-beta hydroxysteroid dehydrogenase/isomerase domain-containing protein n=1 Tax=Stephania japonica TaxID=461633 RepID=A0AAP0J7H6_9MAGN
MKECIGSIAILHVEMIRPASNVLKACSKAKIKRVVMVSSIAAVVFNPNWPEDQVMDEAYWSDEEFCITNDKTNVPVYNWYSLALPKQKQKVWLVNTLQKMDLTL